MFDWNEHSVDIFFLRPWLSVDPQFTLLLNFIHSIKFNFFRGYQVFFWKYFMHVFVNITCIVPLCLHGIDLHALLNTDLYTPVAHVGLISEWSVIFKLQVNMYGGAWACQLFHTNTNIRICTCHYSALSFYILEITRHLGWRFTGCILRLFFLIIIAFIYLFSVLFQLIF